MVESPWLERQLIIPNVLGLHTRASSKLSDCACRFASTIELHCQGQQADAKRIMEVLLLGASHHAEISLRIQGPDAQEAMEAMAQLIESGFGE